MWSEFEKRRSHAGILGKVDESRLSERTRMIIRTFNRTGRSDAEPFLRAVDEARLVGCDHLSFGNSPLTALHRVAWGKSH